MRALILAMAGGLLVASSAVPAALPAPLPPGGQLMALAFPGWTDSPAGHVQSVSVPARARHPGWDKGKVTVLAEPKLVLQTDGEHLVLVAGLVPADKDGKPAASQLTAMALAAYQFERIDGSWRIAGRQGIFGWRGFSGAAQLRAVALSARRQGIAVDYGSCWDGYCGTWMALYEVDKDVVRSEPAVEIALSGTNAGSMADCAHRLQGTPHARAQALPVAKPANASEGMDGESYDCYAIESSWNIEASREQPGDLVIHYQGALSRGALPGAVPSAIDQRQVLRYGSGKYRAVSGFNPVPPI